MPRSLIESTEGSTECPYDLQITPQNEKPRKKVTLIVFSGKNKETNSSNDESGTLRSEYNSSLILEHLACDTTVLDVYYMVAQHFKVSPYSFFLKKGESESNELLSSSDLMESTDSHINNKNVQKTEKRAKQNNEK